MGKAKAAAQPKRGGKGSALLLDLAVEDEHQQGLALLGHTEKAKAGAKRATSVGDIRADLNDKVKELMKEIQTSADQAAATEAIEELNALLATDADRAAKLQQKLRQMAQAFSDENDADNEALQHAQKVIQKVADGGEGAAALANCSSGLKQSFAKLKKKYCAK